MTAIDLTKKSTLVSDGNEGLVVQKALAYVDGGRNLDMTGFSDDVVKAGHIIVRVKTSGVCKPLSVSGASYGELSGTDEFLGVLSSNVSKAKPFASILTIGQVNAKACPYAITDKIKAGLPTIKFI